MAKSKAAQQLADDLKALYEAADCSYEHIIGWGEEQRPKQAKFSKPSLNGWFNGRAVPSRPYDFRRLVELLESRAAKRRPGHRRRTPDEWERLREQAQAKRGAGTRTPVSPPAPPSTVPEQRPVAAGDLARTGRVLSALPPNARWLQTLRTTPMDRIHITVSTAFHEACEQLQREVADFIEPDLHEAFTALTAAMDAFEERIGGLMFGPDPGSPWLVLTNHAPQRPEHLEKLTAARDDFAGTYLDLINLLNVRGLLQPVPGAAESGRADRATAETASTLQALERLDALRRRPNEFYDILLTCQTPESVERRLGPRGDVDADIAVWEDERRALVSALRAASLDLHDDGLRDVIDEVRTVLTHYQGPWEQGQNESHTRDVAIAHAYAAIRSFRQGTPLPKASAGYQETLGCVQDHTYDPESPERA